ncbi:hypothetical protein EDD16DRAFT_644920 [Pisolithus croceorrhizus]|nr:hypothetical protein EDD16DRAFT_644920 [Pisolithus croceorrhizus]KAI6152906.1 hypothetical protein EDD17DRAFT_1124481 [Pisolithus thermaeus]
MAAYNGKATTRENPGCVHCHTQAAVVGCGNLTRAMMCSFRRSLRAIGLWIIEWHPISFFSDHTFPFGRLTDVEREGGKCYAVWTWASLSRPQKLAPDVFHGACERCHHSIPPYYHRVGPFLRFKHIHQVRSLIVFFLRSQTLEACLDRVLAVFGT